MSDLRPRGVPVMVEGVERHFLFTLNVIDEIQDHYDMSLSDVVDKLTDKKESLKVMRYLIAALLNDEVARKGTEEKQNLKLYSEEEVGWIVDATNMEKMTVALLKAYGLSIPEPDEDVSPNPVSGQMKK